MNGSIKPWGIGTGIAVLVALAIWLLVQAKPDRSAYERAVREGAVAMLRWDKNVHREMGNLPQTFGQLDEAIARFDKAIQMEPGQIDAHLWKAQALLRKRDFDRVLRELSPYAAQPAAAYWIGRAQYELMRRDQVRYFSLTNSPLVVDFITPEIQKRVTDARESFARVGESADVLPADRRYARFAAGALAGNSQFLTQTLEGLRQALTESPMDADLWRLRGDILLFTSQGDANFLAEAFRNYREAVRAGGGFYEANVAGALAAWNLVSPRPIPQEPPENPDPDLVEGLRFAQTAIQLFPREPEGHIGLGALRYRAALTAKREDIERMLDSAATTWNDVIERDPANPVARLNRAFLNSEVAALYRMMGKPPQDQEPKLTRALQDAEDALRQAPTLLEAQYLLGMVKFRGGQQGVYPNAVAALDQAAQHFQAVLAKFPRYLDARSQRAGALLELGNRLGGGTQALQVLDLAIQEYTTVFGETTAPAALNAHLAALTARAAAYLRKAQYQEEGDPMEDYGRSIDDYRAGIEKAPENGELHRNLGVACYNRGRFLVEKRQRGPLEAHADALASLDKAVELNDQDGEALYYRAIVRDAIGQGDTAITDLDKGVEIFIPRLQRGDGQAAVLLQRIFTLRGELKDKAGQLQEAMRDYDMAKRLYGENVPEELTERIEDLQQRIGEPPAPPPEGPSPQPPGPPRNRPD